jgi:hypothetical protein
MLNCWSPRYTGANRGLQSRRWGRLDALSQRGKNSLSERGTVIESIGHSQREQDARGSDRLSHRIVAEARENSHKERGQFSLRHHRKNRDNLRETVEVKLWSLVENRTFSETTERSHSWQNILGERTMLYLIKTVPERTEQSRWEERAVSERTELSLSGQKISGRGRISLRKERIVPKKTEQFRRGQRSLEEDRIAWERTEQSGEDKTVSERTETVPNRTKQPQGGRQNSLREDKNARRGPDSLEVGRSVSRVKRCQPARKSQERTEHSR